MKSKLVVFLVFFFGVVLYAVEESFCVQLEKTGYVCFEDENLLLNTCEITQLIDLFSRIDSAGIKAHPDSNGVSHFFLFSMTNGTVRDVMASKGGDFDLALPNVIAQVAEKTLSGLELTNQECLIEAVLFDNFKRRESNKPILAPWRVGFHRDAVAGSCHPFIAVFNLESIDVPPHDFLLAHFLRKEGDNDYYQIVRNIMVSPGFGYLIHENFEPHIYHATTIITEGFGANASRKSLILRIVNKESENYEKMKNFYSKMGCLGNTP